MRVDHRGGSMHRGVGLGLNRLIEMAHFHTASTHKMVSADHYKRCLTRSRNTVGLVVLFLLDELCLGQRDVLANSLATRA